MASPTLSVIGTLTGETVHVETRDKVVHSGTLDSVARGFGNMTLCNGRSTAVEATPPTVTPFSEICLRRTNVGLIVLPRDASDKFIAVIKSTRAAEKAHNERQKKLKAQRAAARKKESKGKDGASQKKKQ